MITSVARGTPATPLEVSTNVICTGRRHGRGGAGRHGGITDAGCATRGSVVMPALAHGARSAAMDR
jgi:hypothetical protein